MTATTKQGLCFNRQYTRDGVSPYDQFEYDYRTSVIRNPNGEKVFEMTNVEVPKHWSQIATDILAQKYFRKAGVPQADGTSGRETSIKQVAHRLADCWRTWGENYGYFATKNDALVFYDELVFSIMMQSCAPNSPQWFNTGLYNSYGIDGKAQGHYYVEPKTGKLERSKNAYERPQPHACFILSVNDDLVNEGGIMDLWVREARIFKYGSGVGTNYSHIRAEGEKLSHATCVLQPFAHSQPPHCDECRRCNRHEAKCSRVPGRLRGRIEGLLHDDPAARECGHRRGKRSLRVQL